MAIKHKAFSLSAGRSSISVSDLLFLHVPDSVVALRCKAGSEAVLCMSGSEVFRFSTSTLIFNFASVDLEQKV